MHRLSFALPLCHRIRLRSSLLLLYSVLCRYTFSRAEWRKRKKTFSLSLSRSSGLLHIPYSREEYTLCWKLFSKTRREEWREKREKCSVFWRYSSLSLCVVRVKTKGPTKKNCVQRIYPKARQEDDDEAAAEELENEPRLVGSSRKMKKKHLRDILSRLLLCAPKKNNISSDEKRTRFLSFERWKNFFKNNFKEARRARGRKLPKSCWTQPSSLPDFSLVRFFSRDYAKIVGGREGVYAAFSQHFFTLVCAHIAFHSHFLVLILLPYTVHFFFFFIMYKRYCVWLLGCGASEGLKNRTEKYIK